VGKTDATVDDQGFRPVSLGDVSGRQVKQDSLVRRFLSV